MVIKKALFITPHDIYDQYGIGGIKATKKNYCLIEQYFGKENTFLCTFPRKEYTEPPQGAVTFKRTQNNMQHLLAALFGCKVYYPWQEKDIIHFIKSKHIQLLFIDSSIIGRLACIHSTYKTIIFYHNIETDYAWNKVKNEGVRYLPSYWASKYNDQCGMKADKVICLNERDSNRLNQLYGRKADFLLPITFYDVFDEKKQP